MFLVTGSSGFIGGALRHSLGNDASYGLRRDAQNRSNEVSCDLADLESVQRAVESLGRISFSHLVHTAAVTPWSAKPDFSQDITMAESVVWLCKQLNIPNLYFISGWNVYDPDINAPYAEDAPLLPNSDYGRSKYNVEKLLEERLASTATAVLKLRLASVYGPGQLSSGLIPNLVTSALNEGRVTIRGPQMKRDYIYIDDVTRAIQELATKSKGSEEGSINIGSGTSVKVLEVAEAIRAIALDKYKSQVDISIQEEEVGGVMDNRLDISKANSMGLLKHPMQLAAGLEAYMNWMEKNI